MDATFSEDEKRFVLSEMIKASTIDVSILVDFIRLNNVNPNWMSMQLPGGRNMRDTIGAVDNMFHVKFPPPNVGEFGKRKSLNDIIEHPPKRHATMAPMEPSLAPARIIQPRPPPRGFTPTAPTTNHLPAPVAGKKRGRPSKADKEAQAQARAIYARTTEYTPITPAPPPATVQPKREYASSPGYEIASSVTDQNSKKRPRPSGIDSPVQGTTPYPLIASASTAGTPRAFPEPSDSMERANTSPPSRESVPVDLRSPPLASLLKHDQTQQPHILPRPQSRSLPIPPLPKVQVYDPIFDRNRSMPDHAIREATANQS
ncbi:hypothetical protein F5Y18DRAFT_234765 [Xylariaceae sp. FL1019]|nr:hypothetical protein F5Y18DRAFT_234765 [Xylariaceae sp. FL1019]